MATSVKIKTGTQDGSSKGKIGFSVTKNKIGSSSTKPGADSKQKSVQTVTKTEVSISNLILSALKLCPFLFVFQFDSIGILSCIDR